MGPGRIGFNPLGIPTLVHRRHSKQADRRGLLGPVYARHSAGDTNEPEAAQTQSGGNSAMGPFGDSGIRYARISSDSETES